jgi:RecJ-like exonuclease
LPLVVCDENDKIIDLMNDSFYNSALNNTEEYTVFVADLKNETADSIIVQQEVKKSPLEEETEKQVEDIRTKRALKSLTLQK